MKMMEMMMCNVYSIRDTQNICGRDVFLDANMILYLFWSTGSELDNEYSIIFNTLISQSKLYCNFTILSEVINRMLKIEYTHFLSENNLNKDKVRFKAFLKDISGISAQNNIHNVITKRIFKFLNIYESSFSKKDLASLLTINTMSFNDRGIAKICRDNNLILMTHDSDFRNANCDILTVNKRYFRQ